MRCVRPSSPSSPLGWGPGIEGVAIPYTTAMLAYFTALGLPTAQRYETLSMAVNKAWVWQRGEAVGRREGNGLPSTSPDLARALRRNPHLRVWVWVASGRYDLGTPYSATDWSLAQMHADLGAWLGPVAQVALSGSRG